MEKVLEVLEEMHADAIENVRFWTHRVNDYHVFQSPQPAIDRANAAQAKAEARIDALAKAIAIIKAAKGLGSLLTLAEVNGYCTEEEQKAAAKLRALLSE